MRKTVLLAVVLVAAGCGSSEKANDPRPAGEPVKRYLVYEKLVGEKGIWIADVDGGNSRPLVRDGHSPVISPDGRSVAYVGGCDADDRCKGTYIVSTSGGKPRHVSSDTPFMWSPDSQRIVVIRGRTPNEELISIDVTDGSTWTLAKGCFSGASFSPDAKQIAYAKATSPTAHSCEEAFDLFVAASDGSESEQITHSGDSVQPVWGPKSIAFSRIVWEAEWGRNEIWRINSDGSGRETITGPLRELLGETSGYDGLMPIAWSDDGDALLGGMLTYTGPEPFAIDPRSGKARGLGSVYEFTVAVGISHDGRFVLADTVSPVGGASADSLTVLIVPYGGGKPRVVARSAGSPSWNR
jgi:dipeptidyl aminopeptidase/acylaminoacyl peptidase